MDKEHAALVVLGFILAFLVALIFSAHAGIVRLNVASECQKYGFFTANRTDYSCAKRAKEQP